MYKKQIANFKLRKPLKTSGKEFGPFKVAGPVLSVFQKNKLLACHILKTLVQD